MSRYTTCPNCLKQGIGIPAFNLEIFQCKYCKWATQLYDFERLNLIVEARDASPPSLAQQLAISDEAYAWLIQTALALGYIRSLVKARNIQQFVTYLSTLEYADHRPAHLGDTDQWYTGTSYMRKRLVRLLPSTGARYRALADHWRIRPYKAQHPILDGRRSRIDDESVSPFYAASAYTAAVLEAIGLRWLRATTELESPRHPPWAYPAKPSVGKPREYRNATGF